MANYRDGIAGLASGINHTAAMNMNTPQKIKPKGGNQGITDQLVDAAAYAEVVNKQKAAKNQMLMAQAQKEGTVAEQMQQAAMGGAREKLSGTAQQVADTMGTRQKRAEGAQRNMLKKAMNPRQGIASMMPRPAPQQRPAPPTPQGMPQQRPAPQGMPVRRATGGIVGYEDGGSVSKLKNLIDSGMSRGDVQRVLNRLKLVGVGTVPELVAFLNRQGEQALAKEVENLPEQKTTPPTASQLNTQPKIAEAIKAVASEDGSKPLDFTDTVRPKTDVTSSQLKPMSDAELGIPNLDRKNIPQSDIDEYRKTGLFRGVGLDATGGNNAVRRQKMTDAEIRNKLAAENVTAARGQLDRQTSPQVKEYQAQTGEFFTPGGFRRQRAADITQSLQDRGAFGGQPPSETREQKIADLDALIGRENAELATGDIAAAQRDANAQAGAADNLQTRADSIQKLANQQPTGIGTIAAPTADSPKMDADIVADLTGTAKLTPEQIKKEGTDAYDLGLEKLGYGEDYDAAQSARGKAAAGLKALDEKQAKQRRRDEFRVFAANVGRTGKLSGGSEALARERARQRASERRSLLDQESLNVAEADKLQAARATAVDQMFSATQIARNAKMTAISTLAEMNATDREMESKKADRALQATIANREADDRMRTRLMTAEKYLADIDLKRTAAELKKREVDGTLRNYANKALTGLQEVEQTVVDGLAEHYNLDAAYRAYQADPSATNKANYEAIAETVQLQAEAKLGAEFIAQRAALRQAAGVTDAMVAEAEAGLSEQFDAAGKYLP